MIRIKLILYINSGVKTENFTNYLKTGKNACLLRSFLILPLHSNWFSFPLSDILVTRKLLRNFVDFSCLIPVSFTANFVCVLLKFYDVRRHFEFEFWDHFKKFASSSIIPVPEQFPNFDLFSAGFEFLKPLGCLMTENCNFKEKLERGEYS